MFGKRLVSGVILLIITIGVVACGGSVLLAVVSLISLIGLFELYRVLKMEFSPLAFAGYVISLLLDGCIAYGEKEWALYIIAGGLLVQLMIYVLCYPKYRSEHITMAFFGIIYVSGLLSYIYQVRTLEDGALIVWLIFTGAWGSDTCAYCVGNLFGKHKLPSKLATLSPHKSLEGCVGGIVGAALIGAVYAYFVRANLTGIENPVLAFAVIGAFASVLSQFGDLTASAIKRNHNMKDYGTLIPGHGGILDRFDSILFTAPLVYMLAILF
ncbi:phosphatidate cytidylyltransferase [Velocimicrobium porci]|uniref:Phosphatidate cytidylyltransferase n=1 Tax=Velocimicrobium porci TaxID=2606634 RepID=A0A6L5Y3A5_9FIRM|nr:phosphatidate cytidylyltransferase [Velocimicrobium porci]MSS64623.1 phosphatidate cytidylyltransferase [Velocimicrobium porci]